MEGERDEGKRRRELREDDTSEEEEERDEEQEGGKEGGERVSSLGDKSKGLPTSYVSIDLSSLFF